VASEVRKELIAAFYQMESYYGLFVWIFAYYISPPLLAPVVAKTYRNHKRDCVALRLYDKFYIIGDS